jgi:hypothetical protein
VVLTEDLIAYGALGYLPSKCVSPAMQNVPIVIKSRLRLCGGKNNLQLRPQHINYVVSGDHAGQSAFVVDYRER